MKIVLPFVVRVVNILSGTEMRITFRRLVLNSYKERYSTVTHLVLIRRYWSRPQGGRKYKDTGDFFLLQTNSGTLH
jgi:hypothetical protein